MPDWHWEDFPDIHLKVYKKPRTAAPHGVVQQLDPDCYTAIIHRYPEPLVRLSNFPTSAEAEAVVEAVMPIYWAERGYE